jgi:hypothetical protein
MSAIIFGDCTCFTCPTPTLMVNTVGASKSKCSANGSSGIVDGHYYLTASYNVYLSTTTNGNGSPSNTGTCTSSTIQATVLNQQLAILNMSTGNCTFTASNNFTGGTMTTEFSDGAPSCTLSVPGDSGAFNLGCDALAILFTWDPYSPESSDASCSCAVPDAPPYDICNCAVDCSEDSGYTYTNEYTDAQLTTIVESLVPSYGSTYTAESIPYTVATFSPTTNSYGVMSSLSVSQSQYKFTFTIPKDCEGAPLMKCYKISWMQGTTAMSYTWDGSATETSLYTATYTEAQSAGGTLQITNVTVSCAC